MLDERRILLNRETDSKAVSEVRSRILTKTLVLPPRSPKVNCWSWWRVMLPFLAFLGHNAVYLLAGFLCFCWLKHEEGEEEPTTVQKHSREGYNLAALLFFFLFLDNLLRSVEGQGWKGFWPCSGRFEVVVLFGMLSLVAQFVYWSRIVSGLNQEHA